jgi:hypothetical protein
MRTPSTDLARGASVYAQVLCVLTHLAVAAALAAGTAQTEVSP